MRSLLDTDVLIHADAADDPKKRRRAIELVTELRAGASAVLSTQVLQEYVSRPPRPAAANGCWQRTCNTVQPTAVCG